MSHREIRRDFSSTPTVNSVTHSGSSIIKLPTKSIVARLSQERMSCRLPCSVSIWRNFKLASQNREKPDFTLEISEGEEDCAVIVSTDRDNYDSKRMLVPGKFRSGPGGVMCDFKNTADAEANK